MRPYNCPACGAPGSFQSGASVYAVCPYCHSMIMRRGSNTEADVEAFGRMAELPPDMSPLQVGTRGMLDGVGFSLIGRLKVGWQDGAWNEWFMLLEDARRGWLAEAQGFFAACFELDNAAQLLNRNLDTWKPEPGEKLSFAKASYEIVDIKQTVCLGSEGELPFMASRGRKAVSIDLESRAGFANLEIQDREVRLYVGRYVGWDELKLDNTRPLEGW